MLGRFWVAARFLGEIGIRVTLIFVVLMLIVMGNMVLVVFPICVCLLLLLVVLVLPVRPVCPRINTPLRRAIK